MVWSTKSNWNVKSNEGNYDAGKDEDGNLELSDKLYKKFCDKNNQIIKKVEEIGLPKQKEQLRIITLKPFNTISIISHICKTEVIEDVLFVIFAINQSAAKIIIDLIKDKKILNCKIIVSSIRNAGWVSKSKAVDMLKEFVEVIYVCSHAKITIMKTDKNNYYNIEGSGNLTFNARIEQYVIDNDINLYKFSKQWIEEIIKFRTN
jgi:hypothetical protein